MFFPPPTWIIQIEGYNERIYIYIYIYIYNILFFFFFHHTTCESTCDTLASSAANQGDNTVSVAQGGTATPGATKQLLPPDRVFKRKYPIKLGDPCGKVANVLNCNIIVNEFKLYLHYYIHFWTNAPGKGINPLIPTPPSLEICIFTNLSALGRIWHKVNF